MSDKLKNAKQSLYNIVAENISEHSENTAVHFFGRKIKYKDFLDEIDRVATFLNCIGVKKGDVITICLPNIPSAFTAFYAVSKLGCIANMVHPLVPAKTLCEIMKNAKSNLIFTLDLKFSLNYELLNNFKCIVCSAAHHLGKFKGFFFKLINRKSLKFKGFEYIDYKLLQKTLSKKIVPDSDYDKPAVYLHSGGTTGEPKTIVLSAFAVNSNSTLIPFMLEENFLTDKSVVAALPMFHGFGLSICINGPLMYGAAVIAIPSFSTKTISKAIKKIKTSYIIGVSAMFEALIANPKFLNKGTKNILRCFCGGETMSLNLKRRYDEVLKRGGSDAGLQEGYGLTEMVSVAAVNLKDTNKLGSVGKPLPGLTVIVIGENNNLAKEGEICFAGDTQMLYYLNDPKTTKEVLFEFDGKTFIRTGDYGYIDEEGYIFIKQRIKRIAKVNGMAVFPLEVERYAEELDFVLNACAVAVKDKRYGEVIYLFIILKDKKYDKEAAEKQLLEYLKQRLIKYAVPRKIIFKESFPKTNVGKIDYKKLMDN